MTENNDFGRSAKNEPNLTQVEVPDQKSICPDRTRRKMSMSRPSQTESAFVQTFLRSRFSCFRRAFKNPHVQTFVRSKLPMSRISCVPNRNSCATKFDNLCVYVQTIARSKHSISTLSFVQNCLCSDFRAFQTKIRALQKYNCNKNLLIFNSSPFFEYFSLS